MYSHAELHLCYRVANARVLTYPYPHFYVTDVFPDEFYAAIQRNIPDPDAMIPIEEERPVKGYKERFVLQLKDDQHLERVSADKRKFWREFGETLLSGRFASLMLQKFQPFVERRLGDIKSMSFGQEALLVQDITKYSLGPHSDSRKKVITVIFYLPADESQAHIGTSIYVPKDPAFRCPGGPHYAFDKFNRMATMPFVPNAMFCFCKTDNSFHGVEPVEDPETRRWLLLFDVNGQEPQQPASVRPVTEQASAPKPAAVKFSF
jgi:hypothetical protein